MAHPVTHVLQCYWVLPRQLLAGEYPAHAGTRDALPRLDALLSAGIDSFIDLTQPDELTSYIPQLLERAGARGKQVTYRQFPIIDLGLPQHPEMRALLDYIDQELAQGHHIYLHCWGGVGRTGMTVGCFLIRHGSGGQQALDQIAEWWQAMPQRWYRPRSPETPEQVQFVLDWREPATAEHQ